MITNYDNIPSDHVYLLEGLNSEKSSSVKTTNLNLFSIIEQPTKIIQTLKYHKKIYKFKNVCPGFNNSF